MFTRQKTCLIVSALALLASGCARPNAWTAFRDKSYRDDIQTTVERKIESQSKPQTGAERWEAFQANDFQSDKTVELDGARLEMERKRLEAARKLLGSGPLTITACLAHTLEYNDRIQASLAAVRSTGGDKLIANSRFLPTVAYNLNASFVENVGNAAHNGAGAIMTLFEFGKDNPIDVALRETQRQALFAHEQNVADLLSAVRERFFVIVLKQQQLAERGKLRDEFVARHDRMVKLEKARRVLEVDVLTAKLNVLNEDLSINALSKETLRLKMDLSQLTGLPVSMTNFELQGTPERFAIPVEDAVKVALRRSTVVAQARAIVFEQDRLVRQMIWDFAPGLVARGGYRDRNFSAGSDLRSNSGTYSSSVFVERDMDQRRFDTFNLGPSFQNSTESGWQLGLALKWQLFSGFATTGEFNREQALLEQDRRLLSHVVSITELAVRRAYEFVLERAREAEIWEETVRISKERLRVQERLKELGKISDNELETFRDRFFSDQDQYFEKQMQLIEAQEALRREMRFFEPLPIEG